MNSNSNRTRAFTLVELLVVIGIIAILMTILIPVVNTMKAKAQVTSSNAQISSLRSAIESYHQTFHAYPGPLSEKQILGMEPVQIDGLQGRPTMSENLFLGLVGGLRNVNGVIRYDRDYRNGPAALRPNGRTYSVFYEQWPTEILDDGRPFHIETQQSSDSNLPEFIDRFDQGMPVLYYRARVGARGVVGMGDPSNGQYDLAQNFPYVERNLLNGILQHGLRAVGSPEAPRWDNRDLPEPAWGGLAYFIDRNIPTSGDPARTGTPRAKDTFVLISAGPDRRYGTTDDITSFGRVGAE